MPTSKVTLALEAVKTALEGITGMQKVWKVGRFRPELISATPDTGFPVALLVPNARQSLERMQGTGRPTLSSVSVSVFLMDNGRDKGDDTWSADRAEELEQAAIAAVLADTKLSGHAYDVTYGNTQYNPSQGAQVAASVGITFDIRIRTREADLSAPA